MKQGPSGQAASVAITLQNVFDAGKAKRSKSGGTREFSYPELVQALRGKTLSSSRTALDQPNDGAS